MPYCCRSQRQPVVGETKGSSRRAELKSWFCHCLCTSALPHHCPGCRGDQVHDSGAERTDAHVWEFTAVPQAKPDWPVCTGSAHRLYVFNTPPPTTTPPHPGRVLLVDSVVITFPICSGFLDQVAFKRQEVWYPTMKPKVCVVLLVKVIPCNPWFWIPPLCTFHHLYEERDVICVASVGLYWEVSWLKALHFRLLIKIFRALFLHSTW